MAELTLQSPVRRESALPHSQAGLRFRLFSWLSHPRLTGLALRLFSAKMLSRGMRARWQVAGVAVSDLDEVLPQIRSQAGWCALWSERGDRRVAVARALAEAGDRAAATSLFLQAFGLYDMAALGAFTQPSRYREMVGMAAAAYAEAAPYLNPPARRVEIPYDVARLAAYFRVPVITPGASTLQGAGKYPVVILVNGAGTIKEELRAMEEKFLVRGLATLSVDGPGMGESWVQVPWTFYQERVAAAVLDFLQSQPEANSGQVGLFGISLGGMSVLRTASQLDRFKAVAAVCPPYDGPSYYRVLPHFIRAILRHMCRLDEDEMLAHAPLTTLRGQIRSIHCPMLVIGAGRDMIVPSGDSRLVYHEAVCEKELLWYPRDEHGALQHLDEWPDRVAEWMARKLIPPAQSLP